MLEKIKLSVALTLTMCALSIGNAEAQSQAKHACSEAANEVLKADAPKELRSKVMRACLAAFQDPAHRRNAEKACDRQAAKVKTDEQFPVAYACTTAMSIAFD